MKHTISTVTLSLILMSGLAYAKKHAATVAPEPPKVYNLTGTVTRHLFKHDIDIHANAANGDSVNAYCNVDAIGVVCDSAPDGFYFTLQDGTNVSVGVPMNAIIAHSDPREKLMRELVASDRAPATFKYRLDTMRFQGFTDAPIVPVYCIPYTVDDAFRFTTNYWNGKAVDLYPGPNEACYSIKKY